MRGKVAKRLRKKTATRQIYRTVKKLYNNADNPTKKRNLLA